MCKEATAKACSALYAHAAKLTTLALIILVMSALLSQPVFAAKPSTAPKLQAGFVGADGNALQGTPNAVVGVLDLYNASSSIITVTGITVRTKGTAKDVIDVSDSRLWLDDGDKAFEPLQPAAGTKDTTIPVSKPDAETMIATTTIQVPARGHTYLFVTVDLTWTADIDMTKQAFLQNGDIVVSSPATVAALPNEGLSSPIMTIADRPDNYRIETVADSPDEISAGSDNNVMQVLTLRLDGDSTTVRSIKVTRTGNTTDTATKPGGVRLWNDIDNSASVTAADQPLSLPTNFLNGVATFSDVNLFINNREPVHALITYSISNDAPLGTAIGSQIADTASIAIDQDDIVKLTRTPLGAGFYDPFGANTLIVNGIPLNNATIKAGTTYKIAHIVSLSALDGNDITLESISYDARGTASASDVSALRLIDDTNKNKVYDTGDVVLDMAQYSSTGITFSLPEGWSIAANGTKNLMVAVDIARTARSNATIQFVLAGKESLVVDADNSVLEFSSLEGPTITIASRKYGINESGSMLESPAPIITTETASKEPTTTIDTGQ